MRRVRLLITALTLLLASCESYDCTLYNYVGLYGSFYRGGNAVAISDTLTITSGRKGIVLLNQAVGTSSLNLPMSYWNEEDTLVFSIKGNGYQARDSVWIAKSNLVHYESPDCPMTLFHTIQSVGSTNEFIDSISIIRSSVNYETTENLRIYLR